MPRMKQGQCVRSEIVWRVFKGSRIEHAVRRCEFRNAREAWVEEVAHGACGKAGKGFARTSPVLYRRCKECIQLVAMRRRRGRWVWAEGRPAASPGKRA